MATRRLIITVTTSDHAELARRAGGVDKLSGYCKGRLLGEPAAITTARYEMALEAILVCSQNNDWAKRSRDIARTALGREG